MKLENNLIKFNIENQTISFTSKETMNETVFYNENEFALHVEANNKTIVLTSSRDFNLKESKQSEKQIDFHYEAKDDVKGFIVDVTYTIENNIVKKNIFIKYLQETKLVRVSSLLCNAQKATAGGEGLPIMVNNAVWCGIEFPAAINEVFGDSIVCHEAPFVQIKEYNCLPVVFGVAISKDLKTTFKEYIEQHQIKKDKMRVYCDWGLHDDMGDPNCNLTAKMTLDNIDQIDLVSKKSGVKFDYYLMDAFWFELNQPYLSFKEETFPEGINPILEKLNEKGMKFGLWFDINLIHAHMLDHQKYDTMLNNGSLCFNEEKVSNYMRDAFVHHIKNNQVKMLKLDFAYFECKNPKHNHSTHPVESKQKSIQNFLKIVKEIREIEPDLKILAYNGWTTSLEHIGEVSPRSTNVISPYWCFYIDYIYCGDPRASEIATDVLSNSLTYYTDSMIRNFTESYMPLSTIDDHGTMTGNTPTIYFEGKNLLRLGWLMDMMRGSRKMHLYGDTYIYDDDDLTYLGYVDSIFDKLMDENYSFSFCAGDVRNETVYGYKAVKDDSYVVLINPSKSDIEISFKNLQTGYILIKNGKISKRKIDEKIVLKQEEYVFLHLDSAIKNDDLIFKCKKYVESTTTVINPNETLLINTLGKDDLYLNFYSVNGRPIRTPKGYPEGLIVMENGQTLVSNNSIDLWSGISWLHFSLKGNSGVEIIYTGKESIKIKYTLGGKK